MANFVAVCNLNDYYLRGRALRCTAYEPIKRWFPESSPSLKANFKWAGCVTMSGRLVREVTE